MTYYLSISITNQELQTGQGKVFCASLNSSHNETQFHQSLEPSKMLTSSGRKKK